MFERRRINSTLEDNGDWLLIDISTERHPEATMKIDKADWNDVCAYGRVLLGRSGYPAATVSGKLKRVHKILCGAVEGKVVDHVNRDKCDNRRENLRMITQMQNCHNGGKRKNNTSGVPGVCWVTSRRK